MSQHEEHRTHLRLRELLGPYVLGGIDGDDRVVLETHLPSCRSCRDELTTYAGLPALLRVRGPSSAETRGSRQRPGRRGLCAAGPAPAASPARP